MIDFSREKVLVAGGLGLIGHAISKKLIELNAIPIIIDLNTKGNAKKIAELKKNNKETEFYPFDLSEIKNYEKLLDRLEKKHGVLSKWALTFYPRTNDWNNKLEKISLKSWQKNIEIQLNSVCMLASQVAIRLSNVKKGSIVTTGSIYGSVAPNFEIYKGTNLTSPAAYSAIKGGISSYSKYLASYFGKKNIRVNCVLPGGVFNDQPDSFVKKYSSNTCLKRMADPEEIAEAFIFLLSDSSSYITGIDLPVDGGLTVL